MTISLLKLLQPYKRAEGFSGVFWVLSLALVILWLSANSTYAENRCEVLRNALLDADISETDNLTADYARAIHEQNNEISAVEQQFRQQGCHQTQVFNAQCLDTLRFIDRMRDNLFRLQHELQKIKIDQPSSQGSILAEMNYYGCVISDELRETLAFMGRPLPEFRDQGVVSLLDFVIGKARPPGYDVFRTVCVRMADGYAFPISFATTNDNFLFDDAACKRACPGQKMVLFVHSNPGQTLDDAISIDGLHVYGEMRGRKRFETVYDPQLSCASTVLNEQNVQPILRRDIIAQDDAIIDSEDLSDLGGDHLNNQPNDISSLRGGDFLPEKPFNPEGIRLVGPGFFPEDASRPRATKPPKVKG